MTTNFIYNITNLTNTNNTLVDIMKYTNEVTDGLFWLMSVFVVWFIVFGSLSRNYGTGRALVTSTFISMVYTVFLGAMGLMAIELVMIPIILTVFMTIILAIGER